MSAKDVLSSELTTAHLADACLRLGVSTRALSLRAVSPGSHLLGPVVPVFLPQDRLAELVRVASDIRDTEQNQTRRVHEGRSQRTQLKLREYVSRRNADPELTFRKHLQTLGGAIEEDFT